MTFDIANAGRYVFYVNFRSVGTQEGVFAEAEQMFNFSNLILLFFILMPLIVY
ncbi:MAG: hypothetical protein IIB81_02920 [Nanoarchaeota archaeon]|nr:hypothetical protein [Nanoarchaeota archaeon]